MDRDIRPSDATYLAEKFGAPMYVSADVFRSRATSFRKFMASHPDCDHSDEAAVVREPDCATSDEECSTTGDASAYSDAEGEREKTRSKSRKSVAQSLTEHCKRAGIMCAPAQTCCRHARSLLHSLDLSRIDLCVASSRGLRCAATYTVRVTQFEPHVRLVMMQRV